MSAPVEAQQIAPHSVEAEEAILGALLLDSRTLDDVREFLAPADFFIVRNGWIYEAICALDDRREQVDYLTVASELRSREQLDGVGGTSYLTQLINRTPSSLYAEMYARLVQRAAVRRGLLRAASEIARAAHDGERDIDAVLDSAEEALFAVTGPAADEMLQLDELLSADMDRVEAARMAGQPARGVPTGFADLDHLLGGFQASDFIIVAGRPGMGKTALMLSMALSAASSGAPALFISLEMSRAQVAQRLLAQVSGLPLERIRQGNLNESEWHTYVDGQARLARLPLFIDDNATLSPARLRTKARRAVRRLGVQIVLVDYLQLMVTAGKTENRAQEVSQITRALKLLAKELNIPLVGAAQLNRKVEDRADKRPQLADLKESGSLEQDSDVVLLLYRDDYYNEASERANQADLLLAKHRNGPTGSVRLYFDKRKARFADMKITSVDLADFSGRGGDR